MRSIPVALTWEMFQRGKWALLAALLLGIGFPALMLTGLQREVRLDPRDHSTVMIHVTMMLINAASFGAVILSAMGRPARFSTFPVTASVIATWTLIPGMAVMGLEYVLTAAAFNAVFELNWPLWGPAMFLAVNLAAVAATAWLAEKSPWYLLVLVSSTMAVLGVWFYSRYGLVPHSGQPRMWSVVTPGEVATMLAIALLAYCGAVVGIARGRCGEYLKTPRLFYWIGKLLDPAPATGGAFTAPAKAQFWFEWRQKGWGMPAIVAMVLLPGFCLWLLFNRDPKELFEGILGGGSILTLGGLVMGLFVGNAGPTNSKMEMGHFLSTRPMTSADMSRAMLKTAGLSVLLAWVMWLVALLAVYGAMLVADVNPRPRLPPNLPWWYFPVTLLGAWACMSLPATIGQTGRPMLFLYLFCTAVALFIASMVISRYALPRDPQLALRLELRFQYVLLTVAGLAFALGTAWAMLAARRRSLIGWPTVGAAFGLWVAVSTFVVLQWTPFSGAPLTAYICVVGLLALPAFPLAGAPLALSWNRNR